MADIVAVHLSLVICATLYAAFLNRPVVHDWYTPDRTIYTVIGGNALIGLHMAALCWLGVLPWLAFVYIVTLNVAAGSVIWIWQKLQARERRRKREERHK